METQNSSLIQLKSWRRKALLAMVLFLIPAISALAADWGGTLASGTYVLTTTTGNNFKVNDGTEYNNIGNITVSSGTVNIVFSNSNTILLNGVITVSSGGILNLTRAASTAATTLKKKDGNTTAYIFLNGNSTSALSITGEDNDHRFVYDGGLQGFEIAPSGDFFAASATGQNNKEKPLLHFQGGNANLKWVDLTNNWVNSTNWLVPAAIYLYQLKSGNHIQMDSCSITNCYAKWGSAAIFIYQCTNPSSFSMNSCEIRNCFANSNDGSTGGYGMIIRSADNCYCDMTMYDCIVSNNYNFMGGIVDWNPWFALLTIEKCTISDNWNKSYPALKISSDFELKSSVIARNHNVTGGAGGLSIYPSSGGHPEYTEMSITLDSTTKIIDNTGSYGAGVYIQINRPTHTSWSSVPENFTMNVSIEGSTISGNKARNHGGGIFVNCDPSASAFNKTIYLNYGNISGNTAGGIGGGIYVGGDVPVNIGGSSYGVMNITSNSAVNGGGIFVNGGDVTMTGGNLSGNLADGGNGGGLYMNGGSFTFTDGTIDNNEATASGGGVYIAGSSSHIDLNGGAIHHNTAGSSGGGLYVEGTIDFPNCNIVNNTANGNSASAGGGGIYISSTGRLNLSGTATVTGNSVPTANGQGGGIYLAGAMTANGDALNVTNNTAGTAKAMNANNVYLPGTYTVDLGNHTYTEATTHRTIEVLGDLDPTKVNLGITTEQIAQQYTTDSDGLPVYFDIPVLMATAANRGKLQDIYGALIEGTSRIRDDRLEHKPKYTTGETILYFTKFQYDYPNFMEETFTNPINTKKKLYQYMCYVNGVNGYASPHPDQDGILTIDIDASDWYRWIPIGCKESETDPDVIFTGNFICKTADQSEEAVHVVRGLQMVADREIYGDFGMFGMTQGATIKGIVSSGSFVYKEDAGAIGCLVGSMDGGTLERCGGSGKLVAAHSGCVAGGLVGKATNPVTIKDCFGTADITGYTMGGLVGTLCAGSSTWNSYTYGRYTRQSGSTDFVGGLAGINAGTFENCFSHTFDTAPTGSFGHFAGQNNAGGAFSYCYAPNGNYISEDNSTAPGHLLGHGTFGSSNLLNGKYGYAHSGQAVTIETGETNGYVRNGADGAGGPLTVATTNDESGYGRSLLYGMLPTLNAWVSDQNTNHGGSYTSWMRTMASPINADMPIHKFGGPICAATPDGHGMDYATDLNNLIWTYNPNNHSGYTATAGSIFLYGAPGTITQSTSASMRLYIPEDLGIVQATGITTHARVGVTFDNSDASNLGGKPYDWHMFSTPLNNVPLGLTNSDEATHYYGYVVPDGALSLSANGYFPTDTPFGSMDFYCYSESDYHWINFKRNSLDHWHHDEPHDPITYTNETNLVQGKGYLLAVSQPTMLMADGVLTNAEVPCDVTATSTAEGDVPFKGINLIGNPYQSYLDFDAFAEETANSGVGVYYILDADAHGYLAYTASASPQPSVPGTMGVASRYIHPHQGFFVKVDADRQLKFTTAMRTATGEGSTFRDGTPRYPLVNLVCTDSQGCNDFATIELDRPEKGGGEKLMELHSGNASIWFHFDDSNWHVAFTTAGTTEAPVRFKAYEDGVFTLRWNTQNADFSYLHLIDNLTGADIDMLAAEQYAFEGTTTDYLSRFKLVFGIDEPEVPEPVESPTTFAFMMGDELVVNGKGTLQMFDMNGRLVMEKAVCGTQTAIAMPKVSAGVYVLQLTDSSQTKVQKLIIR